MEKIIIKGIRDGLFIQVPEGTWNEVQTELLRTIDNQLDFFRGARLTLLLGTHELGPVQLGELRNALFERDVTLWSIDGVSPVTISAAGDLGLIPHPDQNWAEIEEPFASELQGEEAILIRRTIRSGQCIHYPGHVIILGDVNPGAEIIAGGDIIVWGRLRGTVHAGAEGDEESFVCSLDLSPTQLRIAGHIAVSPARRGPPKPEIARIHNEQLVAKVWNHEHRR